MEKQKMKRTYLKSAALLLIILLLITGGDDNGGLSCWVFGGDETGNDSPPANNPPANPVQVATQPEVEISPATTNDNLICNVTTQGTCSDGSTIEYTYEWRKNEAIQEGLTESLVSSTLTSVGDTWQVRVTPKCGDTAGTPVSTEVTISPALPNTVKINFDELIVPEGSSKRFETDLYQSKGAIISMFNPTTETWVGFVVVKHLVTGNGASSEPHSVVFGYQQMNVKIEFVDPITGAPAVTNFVSAMVGDKSRETDTITMTAYDIDGIEIGSDSHTSQPSAQLDEETDFGPVEISVPGIHSVIFTDENPSGADFDDLVFNSPVVPD
jgi:hypothetical protein